MIDEDLEPLITRCPNCATQFRVTENQLAAAGGRVRCGACLTVFQGTDYLLLDEESTFSSGGEADAALDALLDELGFESPATDPARDSEDAAATPADPAEMLEAHELQQIYGGFEDEAGEATGVEPIAEQPAEWASSETESEIDSAPEPETEFGIESGTDTAFDADSSDADAETNAGETASADPPEAETRIPESAEAVAEATVDEWLKQEYEKWIEPDTASIDRLVDEVVTGGQAEQPPEVVQAPADRDGSAERPAEGGLRLSAVEAALEAEGVGTRPISFAPAPRRWWVPAVAAVLILLLLAQVFYLQLPDWSRDPGLRGGYETACALFGCELPQMQALGALQTRNLVVRSHPELEGALIVDAIIVNQAPFPQRYPDLELRFTAVSGLPVAGRAFSPEEYLAGESSAGDLMPINTPVQISLTIADPGREAVNYTLSFR